MTKIATWSVPAPAPTESTDKDFFKSYIHIQTTSTVHTAYRTACHNTCTWWLQLVSIAYFLAGSLFFLTRVCSIHSFLTISPCLPAVGEQVTFDNMQGESLLLFSFSSLLPLSYQPPHSPLPSSSPPLSFPSLLPLFPPITSSPLLPGGGGGGGEGEEGEEGKEGGGE